MNQTIESEKLRSGCVPKPAQKADCQKSSGTLLQTKNRRLRAPKPPLKSDDLVSDRRHRPQNRRTLGGCRHFDFCQTGRTRNRPPSKPSLKLRASAIKCTIPLPGRNRLHSCPRRQNGRTRQTARPAQSRSQVIQQGQNKTIGARLMQISRVFCIPA
jgi:hypothetical protein